VIIFEAPARLGATLADLVDVCGSERPVVVARELTKLHEEVWRGTLETATAIVSDPRGEYVVVLEGAHEAPPVTDEDIETTLAGWFAGGADRRTAVAEVAASMDVPKRRVYEAALRLRPI
jgi:16S rRNA (cytidine1402-2'-O)-methyltransferase